MFKVLIFVGEGSRMADSTTMLSICDPVHLVLIKTDTSSETTLVSSHFLDWRTVLSSFSGKTCIAVELMGVGKNSDCILRLDQKKNIFLVSDSTFNAWFRLLPVLTHLPLAQSCRTPSPSLIFCFPVSSSSFC